MLLMYSMADRLPEPKDDFTRSENIITLRDKLLFFLRVGEQTVYWPFSLKSYPSKFGCKILKQEYIFPTVGISFLENICSTLFRA